MKPDSEMCLRVAMGLAERGGQRGIVDSYCPDDPARTKGAPEGKQFIDLVAATEDGTVFALEHTIIESYPHQLHELRQIEALLLPLEERLAGQLPLDRTFHLSVGIGAVNDPALDPAGVQAGLIPWILETAQALPAGDPSVAPHHFALGRPPDVPVEVTLSAWPVSTIAPGGHLAIWRFGDSDDARMLDRRIARLQTALRRKLPKLLEHEDAVTVLVLEDRDMQTSNILEVQRALIRASAELALSDIVVVVESAFTPIAAVVVYEEQEWHPPSVERHFLLPTPEFDSDQGGQPQPGRPGLGTLQETAAPSPERATNGR